MEKTLVTNATDKVNFLGYEVTVSKRGKHFIKRNQGHFRPSEEMSNYTCRRRNG